MGHDHGLQTALIAVQPGRFAVQRLDTLKFALAGAIYGAVCVAAATICALLGIPGFKPFTDLLAQFYGTYGYSISISGIVSGAFWGFLEGFIHFGIFAWLYNLLLGQRPA
jgi:hypothetical protein